MATLRMRRRTPPQKRIHESKARFNIACWGRQSGKTTTGIDKMTYKPLMGRSGGVYWYVLQTFSTAEIAYDRHARMLWKSKELLAKKPNDSNLIIPLTGGRNVFYKSGQEYQNLRSESLDGLIIDECRQQAKELWTQVTMPMLGRRNGWADFYSTPMGFDWFYDLYEESKNDPNWARFHAPSTEAWWWTEEQIALAKKTMTEAEFAQEIMAEFRNITSGQAYGNFGAHSKRKIPYSPYLPIDVYMDFNISPLAWTLAQFNRSAGTIHCHEEIHIERTASPFDGANALVARLRKLPFDVNRAGGIVIIGDFSGGATQRTSHQSDYDIVYQVLRKAGIMFRSMTPTTGNPPVKDRVNSVNAALLTADGTVRLTLDPDECPKLVNDFERQTWKKTIHPELDPGPAKMLGHHADGVGYGVCVRIPLSVKMNVGVPRVIIR